MQSLSATAAAGIMARGRKLLRRGRLTHRQLALLDCLLWSCRRPGQAWARVSYTRMSELARISRETVARAIKRLAELGLVEKRKERVLVAWGGSVASRQGTSRYRLIEASPTEFARATVIQAQELLTFRAAPSRETIEAQQALAAIAERRRSARLTNL
ncbi:MAG: hypothetical protein JWP57_4410 [Spirosoma sp.]|nr:hypothetical protein [Spirosoma sp.]